VQAKADVWVLRGGVRKCWNWNAEGSVGGWMLVLCRESKEGSAKRGRSTGVGSSSVVPLQ